MHKLPKIESLGPMPKGIISVQSNQHHETNIMKPAYLLLGVIAAALSAFAAVSADSPSADIPLRYVAATELYDAVKQQLGPTAAASVVSVDIRTNTLKLDAAHPDATKVRKLIAKLDQRPKKP